MAYVDHQAGDAAWQQIETNLGPVASGSGTSSGGHFAYDPDQLRDIVRTWNELAADYRDSAGNSTAVAAITAPGLEYASRGHAAMANISGETYLESLRKSDVYCTAQAAKYQKALNAMLGIDDDASISVSKSDQDGGI